MARPRSRSPSWRCALVLVGCWVPALVVRPAHAQHRLYWGDVHGHTDLSDGKGTVEEYLTYARDVAKLDFVMVTDHDFGNAAPWHMPHEAWQQTQAAVHAFTVPGEFVAIAGYEWTSQGKYWTDVTAGEPSERLFPGPPMYYNHKNVYFPAPVEYLFSAKDPAYCTPDLLTEAVRSVGGLIQNNHLAAGLEGRDQFAYSPENSSVITNTEIHPNVIFWEGKRHDTNMEQMARDFLDGGGKTGFVGGTDTHEGRPAARTAVLAEELTREAILDALRHRRNYGVWNARIAVDFRISGHPMGTEVEVPKAPRISVRVNGTDQIAAVEIVRDGDVIRAVNPDRRSARLSFADRGFGGSSYYYVRVTQVDTDEHGNPSRAWGSPVWVHRLAGADR